MPNDGKSYNNMDNISYFLIPSLKLECGDEEHPTWKEGCQTVVFPKPLLEYQQVVLKYEDT
jgi:hypothetical protein